MKFKNMKKIIGFIICLIIVSGISVYATMEYQYSANLIRYQKENQEEIDVKSALDELYSMRTRVYYLGTGASFNIKNLFPDDYTSLTSDNFIIGVTNKPEGGCAGAGGDGYSGSVASGGSSSFTLSKSYSASTGVLEISGTQYYNWASLANTMVGKNANNAGHKRWLQVTPFAYLVIGNISDKSE